MKLERNVNFNHCIRVGKILSLILLAGSMSSGSELNTSAQQIAVTKAAAHDKDRGFYSRLKMLCDQQAALCELAESAAKDAQLKSASASLLQTFQGIQAELLKVSEAVGSPQTPPPPALGSTQLAAFQKATGQSADPFLLSALIKTQSELVTVLHRIHGQATDTSLAGVIMDMTRPCELTLPSLISLRSSLD